MLWHGGTFPPCHSILQVLVSPRLCAVFLFRRHVREVFDNDAEPFGCSVCLRPPKRRLSPRHKPFTRTVTIVMVPRHPSSGPLLSSTASISNKVSWIDIQVLPSSSVPYSSWRSTALLPVIVPATYTVQLTFSVQSMANGAVSRWLHIKKYWITPKNTLNLCGFGHLRPSERTPSTIRGRNNDELMTHDNSICIYPRHECYFDFVLPNSSLEATYKTSRNHSVEVKELN